MDCHSNSEQSFTTITDKCREYYNSTREITPCALAAEIMADASIPMHNFAHHYLVPAVLMTIVCRKKEICQEVYEQKMAEVEKRSGNVLPAFCGFYGACGAAIGVGLFMSVYTNTTPLTKEYWGACNMATALALQKMGEIGGPRCCKRNTFLALNSAADSIHHVIGIDIEQNGKVECDFSRHNAECLKDICPFFKNNKKYMLMINAKV